MSTSQTTATVAVPRVAITFCTQCRWMLRAAYFGQELLSTFGTSIGEVALIPATGGVFQVHLTYHRVAGNAEQQQQQQQQQAADGGGGGGSQQTASSGARGEVEEVLIWDRKAEGGFPETKILKQKVRNLIAPGKDLGHSDKPSTSSSSAAVAKTADPQVEIASSAATAKVGGEAVAVGESGQKGGREDCEDCK